MSITRRKFVWRLSMTKFKMKTCLSLKDKSFIIITLSYIFRNFFVKLTIKLFTSFKILFLTYSEIWKRQWTFDLVSLLLLTKFASLYNKYTIDIRISKKRKSSHVNNVWSYLISNSFSSFWFRCRSRSLLRRLFSWSLQFIFTLMSIRSLVIRWSTIWSSRINVSHMTNQITLLWSNRFEETWSFKHLFVNRFFDHLINRRDRLM